MSHIFLKYAPLRIKPCNTETPSSDTHNNESLVGNSRHFASIFHNNKLHRASRPRAKISNNTKYQTQLEEAPKAGYDATSLENVNVWFQPQERRASDLQSQLEASIAKNDWLKSSLEKSQKEVQNLQNLNEALNETQAVIQTAIKNAEKLFAEVNENVSNAKNIVDQVKQDRETWLNNLKECQRSHFDRRVMLLHSDYQKTLGEKEAQIASKQSRLEVLEVDLANSVAKIGSLQHELLALKTELEKIEKDKRQLSMEKHHFEAECVKLNQGLDEILKKRTTAIQEELSRANESNTLAAKDLKDCQEKLNRAESCLEVITKELQHIKKEEKDEPKEKLRTEISSLKSEILELSSAIIEYKKNISSLQEDLLVAQVTNRHLEEANKSLPLLSKERAALQEKFVSLENQNESLTVMLTEISTERDLYKSIVEERDAKLSQADSLNNDLEKKIETLTSENNELKAKMRLIEMENREFTKRIATTEQSNKEFQEMAEERDRTLDEAKQDLVESQRSLSDAKKEIAELKRELMGCHLKLDYANERLNQMENEDNVKQKAPISCSRQTDDCSETSQAKPLKFATERDMNTFASTDSEEFNHYSDDCFAKPEQRASMHEFPVMPKERAKEKASAAVLSEATAKLSRNLNPLELLEKADAIVAKEKGHHHSDNKASIRKLLVMADIEISKHQKKQRVEHDNPTGNWECQVAPSPVIKTNWKY